MKASDIIELIISRHENKDESPIHLHGNLQLEPMINYKGKMARKAYWGFSRKPFHEERLYCGILDYKIMNNSEKMEHFGLMESILNTLKIEDIRAIFDGADPEDLGRGEEETALLSEVQCSFLEQEINWGPFDFQLRTFFGLNTIEDTLLSEAVPRDFFMVFIEKCFAELASGCSIEEALSSIDSHYQRSEVAGKSVLKPPKEGSGKKSKMLAEYRPHVYGNKNGKSTLWIEPYLERIKQLCEKDGPSPYWSKAYQQ